MSAGIASGLACSKIWPSAAPPLPGKLLALVTLRPAQTVVERLCAAGSSRVISKPTATTTSRLRAATAIVRSARPVIFPLDKQLALLPGLLTPLLQDHLAHLSAWMPFGKAAALLECFTQTRVSESTAQLHTEAVGLAYEAVQLAEVERIERDWPEVKTGPDKLALSADGAMVPLIGGEWAEVKTLVVGEVVEASQAQATGEVKTCNLSYFSRLSDAESFPRLTLGELYRRRLESASQVAAVSDGAEWIQGFLDYHCPSAKRILDFPHAAQRICQIGEVVLGAEHPSLSAWQKHQLHQLKHQGAEHLLDSLRTFAAAQLSEPLIAENLAYLEKRVAQMQYAMFQAQGWPIGSGMVESANKLVVEARLKGAGMHWTRASVNPLLALRNAVCNDRWEEAWRESSAQIERVGKVRRAVQPKRVAGLEPAPALAPALPVAVVEPQVASPSPSKAAATHPWRRTNYATKARVAQAGVHARK